MHWITNTDRIDKTTIYIYIYIRTDTSYQIYVLSCKYARNDKERLKLNLGQLL